MLAFKPIPSWGMSDQTMTIGITGPRRRAPWRGAVVGLFIAAIIVLTCLILLGLTGDFLVDLWFSAIGYLGVFWTTTVAEAEVFFAVFMATAIILWVNGSLATRFARSPWTQRPADFEWKRTGIATSSDVLDSCVIGCRGPSSSPVALASSLCLSPGERSTTGASSIGSLYIRCRRRLICIAARGQEHERLAV
jgi:uncharacterized protein